MSKIEDALKKARKGNPSNQLTARQRSDGVSAEFHGGQHLVTTETEGGVASNLLNRRSSAKEIALMDSGELHEKDQLSELKVIYSDMSNTKIANTYRDLRTKLIHKSEGKNFVVMLTSCVPEYDVSHVAMNLSIAFTFDQSKTSLFVDCNLNNPSSHKLMNTDVDQGLTDYLENEDVKIEDIIHKPGVKRLSVIPSGSLRETAAEYFTSNRMRNLMSRLLQRYADRYIFLNTASINESADTKILTDLCDYVIMVVPYGRASKKVIQNAAKEIGQEKLLGVIFSDVVTIPSFRISNKK